MSEVTVTRGSITVTYTDDLAREWIEEARTHGYPGGEEEIAERALSGDEEAQRAVAGWEVDAIASREEPKPRRPGPKPGAPGEPRRVVLSGAVSERVAAEVDAARGDKSRSTWVAEAIERRIAEGW